MDRVEFEEMIADMASDVMDTAQAYGVVMSTEFVDHLFHLLYAEFSDVLEEDE